MATHGRTYLLIRFWSFLLYVIGIVLSLYAFYVEFQKETHKDFVAACDISETMSCSKVFASKYGRGFGLLGLIVGYDHWINLPNSIFGLCFYLLQSLLTLSSNINASILQIVLSVIANFSSVYLAMVLYNVLGTACVVCVATYLVNFLILVCNVCQWCHLKKRKSALGQSKKTQ